MITTDKSIKKICIVAGWASNLSQLQVLQNYNENSIQLSYLDYSELLDLYTIEMESLVTDARFNKLMEADTIVAWSLGTLFILQRLHAIPKHIQLVLLAPFTNFTHPQLGWQARVIRRMQSQLLQNSPAVLTSFAQNLHMPNSHYWIDAALQYSTEQLHQGLEILATNSLNAPFKQNSISHKIQCIWGTNDTIVNPQLSESCYHWICDNSLLEQPKPIIVNDSGHWLFSALPKWGVHL